MAKRDKVLSEEVAASAEETPMTPNSEMSIEALPSEVQEMLKRYEERAQAAEADKEKAERKAAEAQERLKAAAQAQVNNQRPSSLITSAILEDRVVQQMPYVSDERPKVRPDQLKIARGEDLGGTMRTIVCDKLAGSGRTEVQVNIPNERRLATGFDAYKVEFFDSLARVPQLIAEILCEQQPHRYILAD